MGGQRRTHCPSTEEMYMKAISNINWWTKSLKGLPERSINGILFLKNSKKRFLKLIFNYFYSLSIIYFLGFTLYHIISEPLARENEVIVKNFMKSWSYARLFILIYFFSSTDLILNKTFQKFSSIHLNIHKCFCHFFPPIVFLSCFMEEMGKIEYPSVFFRVEILAVNYLTYLLDNITLNSFLYIKLYILKSRRDTTEIRLS